MAPSRSVRVFRLVLAMALLLAATSDRVALRKDIGAQAPDPCTGTSVNPIACENSKPGTPASTWDISGAGSSSIQGFATDISVNKGQTIGFKVDTSASSFSIDVYRLGYYGGNGARLIANIPSSQTTARDQPSCLTDGSTGLVDCGNWSQSALWAVPSTAVSGIYIARLNASVGSSHVIFIVRDDNGQSDILFQASDTTWQAYNTYGGNSLYVGSPAGRAYEVSYNRPFITRSVDNGQDWVFNAEYPMIRWLEANGYNVSYSTGVDTDRRGAELLEHKVFLSVGHDEYWSGTQRTNVEAARAAGVHLAFFSGNEVFWKTRWDTSIDGSGTPYRTLVCYKETHASANIDPSPEWTGTWRDPRFSPPADGGRPENALTGTAFTVNAGTSAIRVPEAYGKARFWRNTSVATLAAGATATLTSGTLGYEWDEDLDNGSRPPGLIQLSQATVSGVDKLQDYGNTYATGTATHSLTLYRHSSGALVFGAGTIQYAWGLDGTHDRGTTTPSTPMRQATVNLLADMGVQPSTLQSGLTAATASTDSLAPVTTITSPAAGATVSPGAAVTLSGTATDTGGIVGAVEVSIDGGATWERANGRTSWTYSFNAASTSTMTLRSRGIDDSGNVESPGASRTINVSGGGTSGLVAAYAFDEGAGTTVTDASGRGNNGTISGATWTTGRSGNALSFNGTNAMVTIPDSSSLRLTSAMTIAAWVRPTTVSGWRTVLMKERPGSLAYTLYSHDTTRPAAWISVGGADLDAAGGSALAANVWAHMAATFDGVTLRLYINGSQVATRALNGAMPSSTNPLRIGGNTIWGEYFAGLIDDVRVYASVLSASQIVSDMNTPVGTPPADTLPPTVTASSPTGGSTNVALSASLTATFSESMTASTVSGSTFELRNPANQLVSAAVSYNAATLTATLDPASDLSMNTTYTARVRGGSADPRVKDAAGNALAADVSWSFTTVGPPANEGPGGPILVISSAGNPFTRYYSEILRNEGLNYFTVSDISLVTPAALNAYDGVILGEMSLTAPQVTMLTDWVNAGGNLIAMRPDAQLADLLGLTVAAGTRSNQYLLIGSSGPGAGLVNQTIQFHGTANNYTLSGATSVATLYSNASTATSNPAVTLRSVGANGGQAAAFAYDLARSVVYTRQGNPDWSGQERDGQQPPIIRSDDLFFGAKAGDVQPDWIDLNKVAIPQADEQMRLVANLILQMTNDRKPLPRTWYLPRGLRAAVVMTGDDHAGGGTAGRWENYKTASPVGCSVANWECVRATSYLYPNSPLTNTQAQSYNASGFEVALHVNTNCEDWTPSQLAGFFTSQLASFAAKYTSVPASITNRNHCITWSDYTTQPKVELNHGIRFDTTYYYWPDVWVQDRAGFFTGSGMPMRFADTDGTLIDVYQAATQMTDESGQSYPSTIDTLLNRATGTDGYYGVFTANMHTDTAAHAGSDAIVASAQARGVPIVSSKQMLTWLDGRNSSTYSAISWGGGVLNFTLSQAAGATGLQVLLPSQSAAGPLASITRGGSPVTFVVQTIKGIPYATFTGTSGTYAATYSNTAPPDTTITASPDASTTSTSASFSFTSSPAGATFECSLDAAPFGLCSSPQSYSPLALGSHTFQVRSVNGNGPDPSPATFTWTITAPVPPDTTITSKPGASTTLTTATFSFTSTPAGATFECSVDAAPFGLCSSPQTYSSLTLGTHTFRVRAVGAGGPDGSPASFTWTINAPGACPCSIWSASAAPTTVDDNDPSAVTLGVKFQSERSGNITGIRFYKGPANTGTHIGSLWTAGGTLLGSVTFQGETASGWQEALFPSPIPIEANTTYVASYFAPAGHYPGDDNFFAAAGVDNPPLHALSNGTSVNGVYKYGSSSAFPNETYLSENYWVDVVFADGAGDTTAPVVSSVTPLPGATGVAPSGAIRAIFNESMDAATIGSATFELRDPSNNPVLATVSYNAATRTATLQPSSALSVSTVYTASVRGGATDPAVKDLAGNPLANTFSWSFRTSSSLTAVTAVPSAVTIQTGTLAGGTFSSLSSDDNAYYQVNSTTSGTRTTAWYGSFNVPNELGSLSITYRGRNSQSSVTQTIAIWRWTDSTWVQLDSRTVGTTEVSIANLIPTGTLADYVNGTSGVGELRIRVRSTRSGTTNFISQGDLMSITYFP
jgi:hypothetical protein